MTRHHRGTKFRPRLESLDDRACPSCLVELVGSTLTITGDDLANNVAVTDRGPLGVRVACDGQTTDFTEPIDRVVVNAGDGNDRLTARFGESDLGLSFFAELGSGNDFSSLDYSNTVFGLTTPFDPMRFTVLGGDGNDVLLSMGAVAEYASVTMAVDGGHGDDRIINDTWLLAGDATLAVNSVGGSGSDLIFETYIGNLTGTFVGHADGGNGTDTIDTALGWDFGFLNIAPGGEASYDMAGGNGDDLLRFICVGRVDGQLDSQANGGNGNDTIDASQMWVNAESTGEFSANFLGGNGNDVMTVQVQYMVTELIEVFPGFFFEELIGFTDTPAPLSSLSIAADGGNGLDTCLHSAGITLLGIEDDQSI